MSNITKKRKPNRTAKKAVKEVEICYVCNVTELTKHDDSGRCESCLDDLSEEGEGWDN